MSLSQPLISVVMCTYNGETFVERQLRSICAQTYSPIEIIIVDDKSTDGTKEIIGKVALSDKRISIFQNEDNIGFTQNFNKAFSLAKGELIAPADQDDIWHPEKLQRLISNWKDGAALMYCNSIRFESTEPSWDTRINPHYRRFEGKDGKKLSLFNTISGHALILKRSLLEHLIPVQKEIMYDWWAGMMAAYHGGVGYLPETLVLQRIHGNNISVGGSFEHTEKASKPGFNKLVLNHLAQFKQTPDIPETDKNFLTRFFILWEKSIDKKFSLSLFLFLVRYGRTIFNFKKKSFAFFSRIKHSFRLASN